MTVASGSRPYLRCASARPATLPGTPAASGPTRLRSLTGLPAASRNMSRWRRRRGGLAVVDGRLPAIGQADHHEARRRRCCRPKGRLRRAQNQRLRQRPPRSRPFSGCPHPPWRRRHRRTRPFPAVPAPAHARRPGSWRAPRRTTATHTTAAPARGAEEGRPGGAARLNMRGFRGVDAARRGCRSRGRAVGPPREISV